MESSDYVRAFWYSSNNFGDNLNHFLIGQIGGRHVVLDRERPHYIVCGSILAESRDNSIVCGAGFGSIQQKLRGGEIIFVRGRLSARMLKTPNIPCGDPALLLPMFYDPVVEKKYPLSVVPHWSEMSRMVGTKDAHVIDPFLPVKDFVDEIKASERVVSSSLHGLIAADAYGVPNAWMSSALDTFKFADYYSTTTGKHKCHTTLEEAAQNCAVHEYKYDKDILLSLFPFKK